MSVCLSVCPSIIRSFWLTETQPSIPVDGAGAAPWGRGSILAPVIEMPAPKGGRTHLPAAGRGLEGVPGVPQPHYSPLGSAVLPSPSSTLLLLPDPGRCRGGERHLQLHRCLLAPEPLPESKSFFKENPKLL